MIVFGDPQFRVRLHGLLRVLSAPVNSRVPGISNSRQLLIRAGQLEQALFDWLEQQAEAMHPAGLASLQFTDAAAACFNGEFGDRPCRDQDAQLQRAWHALLASTMDLDPELCVKVPEGFQFYCLYPEQYFAAARLWCDTHPPRNGDCVLVVGVRSIGTSLSAVIADVLRQHGWNTARLTVRPTGHPFSRRTSLADKNLSGANYALVVDEGPGMSGSSMASVAQALCDAGLKEIAFLPGHAGMPGTAGNTQTAQWWQRVPKFVAPAEGLRWNGKSLTEMLTESTERILSEPVTEVYNAGGGAWRGLIWKNEQHWPAAYPMFERAKWLCRGASRKALLWKFSGLGSLDSVATGDNARPLTIKDVAEEMGFTATRWIEGLRFRRSDSERPMARQIGIYLAESAKVSSDFDSERAVQRLAHMLFWNTLEALGEEMAEMTQRLFSLGDIVVPQCPVYTDGRMGPWEWIRTTDGQLQKTDWCGHRADHTIVGEQSYLWDIAGTLVEWNWSGSAADELIGCAATRYPFREQSLGFYRAAYAAFRWGMCSLCAGQARGAELERLQRGAVFYSNHLASTLSRAYTRITAY